MDMARKLIGGASPSVPGETKRMNDLSRCFHLSRDFFDYFSLGFLDKGDLRRIGVKLLFGDVYDFGDDETVFATARRLAS